MRTERRYVAKSTPHDLRSCRPARTPAGFSGYEPLRGYCRIGGGRHTFVFYKDSVQVFGPGAEPLTPTDSFDWQPR